MYNVVVKGKNAIRSIWVVASTPFEAIQRAMWEKECYHLSKNVKDYKAIKK